MGQFPVLLLSIAAALGDCFQYYYCLLQRHSGNVSRAITLSCSGTLGLFPVLLLSIAATLWDCFQDYYSLLQRKSGTVSINITVYCSGILELIFVFLLPIAANCTRDSRTATVYCSITEGQTLVLPQSILAEQFSLLLQFYHCSVSVLPWAVMTAL
jgi:hypothetical protein